MLFGICIAMYKRLPIELTHSCIREDNYQLSVNHK
jgi:hypothetical protein